MRPSITNPIRKYFRLLPFNKEQKLDNSNVYRGFHRFPGHGDACELFNTIIFKVLYSQQHDSTTAVAKNSRKSLDIHESTLVNH
jgi:hypothetical protein